MSDKTYKFIKEGKGKFTAQAGAIKNAADYQAAVDEAYDTGKPYFISAIIDGREYRSIAWNKAEGGLEHGAWDHEVCKSLDDLRKVATDGEIFGYAYAQFRIKGDANAVHPPTGRVGGGMKKAEIEKAAVLKAMVGFYKTMPKSDAVTDAAIKGATEAGCLKEFLEATGLDAEFTIA